MSLSKNQKLISVAKQLCRDLRKHSTKAEQLFWETVRDRRFINKKFYRQYPIFFDMLGKETFFIADFYCHEEKLVIEIDGGYHKRQEKHDALRTYVVNKLGIDLIRFTNEEVENNIKNVLREMNNFFTNKIYTSPFSFQEKGWG